MNREIKFRAWLYDEGQMVFSNDQASTDSCEVWQFYDGGLKVQVQETIWREGGGEIFERIEYADCNHSLMQFTGLKDKNGKEIYEGDIMDSGGSSVALFIIYFKDGGFWYKFSDESCDIPFAGHQHLENILSRFHVIGNIYENPELIN